MNTFFNKNEFRKKFNSAEKPESPTKNKKGYFNDEIID
jgi:hypothetical protein